MFNQDMGHLMNPDPERPVFTETAEPRHRWQGRISPPSVQGFSNTSPGQPDPTRIPANKPPSLDEDNRHTESDARRRFMSAGFSAMVFDSLP